MSMIFYTYDVPEESILYKQHCMDTVFIAYNPIDGETAFFEVYASGIEPFDADAMRYVNSRFEEYCKGLGISSPENSTDQGFDFEGHKDFMRTL